MMSSRGLVKSLSFSWSRLSAKALVRVAGDELCARHEEHRLAGLDRLAAEGDGEMGLVDAARAKPITVSACLM
jgi:hypothetical protein